MRNATILILMAACAPEAAEDPAPEGPSAEELRAMRFGDCVSTSEGLQGEELVWSSTAWYRPDGQIDRAGNEGSIFVHEYDGQDLLQRIVGPDGVVLEAHYEDGVPVRVESDWDSDGNIDSFQHYLYDDADTHVETHLDHDADGAIDHWVFNEWVDGLLMRDTNAYQEGGPVAYETLWTYEGDLVVRQDQVTYSPDSTGAWWSYAYDGDGREVRQLEGTEGRTMHDLETLTSWDCP